MRQLSDYEPYLSQVLKYIAPQSTVTSNPALAKILAAEPKLIVAFNHAAPLSWVPAICLLTREVCRAGGGKRLPRGIMDQFFFQFPPLRPLAKYITQSDRYLNFEELVEDFESSDRADLVVFPEGSNCFFGPSDEVQEFRSPRFIEIAIRTDSPILIAVHSGSEEWGKLIHIPPTFSSVIPFLPQFAQKGIAASGGMINLPMLPLPIKDFRMHCEVYRPALKSSDLSEDKAERRQQLLDEAADIHDIMETTLQMLQEQSADAESTGRDTV